MSLCGKPALINPGFNGCFKVDGDLVLEEDMYLVTCDVKSLYTCIDYSHSLHAIEFFLSIRNLDQDLVNLLLVLMESVLCHNYFIFKDHHYLQIQGTSMVTTYALSYREYENVRIYKLIMERQMAR